jgi:hypothetical protein
MMAAAITAQTIYTLKRGTNNTRSFEIKDIPGINYDSNKVYTCTIGRDYPSTNGYIRRVDSGSSFTLNSNEQVIFGTNKVTMGNKEA